MYSETVLTGYAAFGNASCQFALPIGTSQTSSLIGRRLEALISPPGPRI
jgi:hypothetical protein